ncbi:MAG: FISUMP domain-containing protein [Bacteroidota bacterium]
MKNSTIIIFLVLAMLKTQAQDYLISFTGAGATTEVGTVKVDNLTSGATLTLNGGDILHLTSTVGISNPATDNGTIRVYPNPMTDRSTLTFVAPDGGNADICIVDLAGKTLIQTSTILSPGTHSFHVSGIKQGMYFVKVTGKNYFYSTKLISQSNLQSEVRVEYISTINSTASNALKSISATIDMPYANGDQLLFKGISGIYSTLVPDVPVTSKTITFNFAACTDADGNNYATVQIGTLKSGKQTWMAENLNVGVRIDAGTLDQTNNNIIEKYCYNNDEANCAIYGGLYQWNEMMQYVTTPEVKGICPTGWHIPTDGEWTTLTTFLEGESVVGGKMKSIGTIQTGTGLWNTPNTGATNESGFTAVPAGCRCYYGPFNTIGYSGTWWSSSEGSTSDAWLRHLSYNSSGVGRNYDTKTLGFSVRCLRDF